MGVPCVSPIIRSFTICKQAGRYIGWPSVAKTATGELLAVFSGDREEHVCPYGKTFLVRSVNRAETWSMPEVVNDTPLDDRDAGIMVLQSGTIVVRWFTSLAFEEPGTRKPSWDADIARIKAADRERWLSHWTRRSTDGGRTWEDPVRLSGYAPHGATQLRGGRLVNVGVTFTTDFHVVVEASSDEARTWQTLAEVPVPAELLRHAYCDEPHVVETADGRLVTMFRIEPRDYSDRNPFVPHRFLWQSHSDDGGRTWAVPVQTPLWGYPPHLLRLSDGRLLVTYGYRREPFGQRACISTDQGRTWDTRNEIVIRDDAPSGDLGYPASVELDSHTILTVYYQIERRGEKPCLMGTIWNID